MMSPELPRIVSPRIVSKKDATQLIDFLKNNDYGVTSVDGHGATGRVSIIYTFANRNQIPDVVEIIKKFNPNAFYTIEDVRTISEAITPAKKNLFHRAVHPRN